MSTEITTDFESAFAEAMGETADPNEALDTPADTAPADDTDTSAEQQLDVAPGTEAAGGDTGAEQDTPADEAVDDTAAAESTLPPAAEAAPVQDPAHGIDPKYLAQAIAEAQEQARLSAEAAAKQKEEAASNEKVLTAEDFLDDNQKKAIELLNSEWSDVAGPVQALIAANVQAALANQERMFKAHIQQQMAPIQQVTAQSQEAMYWATVSAAHPDVNQVAGALSEWIETQPALVKSAYMSAYNSPNPADAVELLSIYKQAIGQTGAAPAQPASSAAQVKPKAAPVSKAALAATAAVPTAQRSKMADSRDPNDFESAWMEAANR